MLANQETLLRLLAETDGLFAPVRGLQMSLRPVVYERQQAYFSRGLRWAAGGLKATQALLLPLAERGLVEIYNPSRARTLAVRLTPAGGDNMRRLVGLPTFSQALAMLDELYRQRESPNGFSGPGCGGRGGLPWTSEACLTGTPWGSSDDCVYGVLWEDALPLLNRGLVQANSDCERRVWYQPTKRGYELAQWRVETGAAIDFPQPLQPGDDDAYSYYRARRDEAIDAPIL